MIITFSEFNTKISKIKNVFIVQNLQDAWGKGRVLRIHTRKRLNVQKEKENT